MAAHGAAAGDGHAALDGENQLQHTGNAAQAAQAFDAAFHVGQRLGILGRVEATYL